MRIMRVDSYNTTTPDQGAVWWKKGPAGDILDIALGSDNLPRFITSTGLVVKMNEWGSVAWVKGIGSSNPQRIRIDSNGDMWIVCNTGTSADITVVKSTENARFRWRRFLGLPEVNLKRFVQKT